VIVGIVGAGADKFTLETETKARAIIQSVLMSYPNATITSGHSIRGGVDIFTEEGFYQHPTTGGLWIRAPVIQAWPKQGKGYGYMARNLDIAQADLVVVIVVKDYPPGFVPESEKFLRDGKPYCYHCKDKRELHVKSGACWTGLKAIELGHKAIWYLL
jgi:hypothetical protein